MSLQDYFDKVRLAESGGRNVPSNIAGSSAFGPYQFLEGTWQDVMRRHPDAGLTAADRYDPAKQDVAMRLFTADNAGQLRQGLGRDPTTAELQAAHRFGAEGALQLASADPNTPLGKVLPKAAAANPQWANKTAGQLIGGRGDTQMSITDQNQPTGQTIPSPPAWDAGAAFDNIDPRMSKAIGAMLAVPDLVPQAFQMMHAIAFAGAPQAQEPFSLSEGQVRYDENGRPIAANPKAPTAPTMRTVTKGDQEVQQEFVGGKWSDVGGGPRWAPQAPGEAFVGQPVPDANGNFVIRNKNGELYQFDPQGKPVPYGTTQSPMQAPQQQAKAPAEEIKTYEDSLVAGDSISANIAQLRELYGKVSSGQVPAGPEMVAARQRITQLTADTHERINKLNQNGVMNEGDLEQVRKMLPDPTALTGEGFKVTLPVVGSVGIPGPNMTTAAGYNAALGQIDQLVRQRMGLYQERATRQGVKTRPEAAQQPQPQSAAPTIPDLYKRITSPGASSGW